MQNTRFLKNIREELGFTKYQMANHLGILAPTYYYFEEKAKGCSFQTLSQIRRRLGLSWDEIGAYIDAEYANSKMEEITVFRRKAR